jgi:hypothetical protein
MKNIRPALLFLALAATTAHAQIAMEGGYHMTNLSIKTGDIAYPTKAKNAIMFGLLGDIRMGDRTYFQTGLMYELNGCTLPNKPKGDYTINTINIPLNLEYQTGDKCSGRFTFGGGPYIAINTSGTYSIDSFAFLPARSGELVFGTDATSNMKEVDLRFGVHVGVIPKKHFYLRARYQIGLMNLVPGGDNKNYIKTSALSVVVGYLGSHCRQKESTFGQSGPNHWRGLRKGVWSRKPRLYRERPFYNYERQR